MSKDPPPPNWIDDIEPMLSKFAPCMIAQRNLNLGDYKTVYKKADDILTMISIIPPSTVPRMPPDPTERLSDEQIETFQRWIQTGKNEKPPGK